MSKAQQMLDFIETGIAQGSTIHLSTCLKTIAVSPKTYAKFEASGHTLFMIDKSGDLRIASGKNFNVICTPTTSLVTVKAFI